MNKILILAFIALTSGTACVSQTCKVTFSVLKQDALKNVAQGLSANDVKWYKKKLAKKYRDVCYAEPSTVADEMDNSNLPAGYVLDQGGNAGRRAKSQPTAEAVPVVFVIIVTPAVYHGTTTETQESKHESPVRGTVTDEDGNTSRVEGTVTSTTETTTTIPYSVDYGLYTLSIETKVADGTFAVHHRFQQKGLYTSLYGFIPVGKGHQPVHAVIEDAVKWVHAGGLADPKQTVAN